MTTALSSATVSLLLLLSFLLSLSHQQLHEGFDLKALLANVDDRAKAIEEMTKRAAFLQNQKEAALRGESLPLFSSISVIPSASTLSPLPLSSTLSSLSNRRPTEEDDLLFLKKMKDQSELVQNTILSAFPRTVQGVELLAPPPPPFIPYPPQRQFFLPQMTYFPAVTRIAARPAPLLIEDDGPRPQLPLRGAKNLI